MWLKPDQTAWLLVAVAAGLKQILSLQHTHTHTHSHTRSPNGILIAISVCQFLAAKEKV